MASIVKQSRLIFIDSELNGHPNAVVTFPSQPFSVCCSDHMRLTLLSFQMRRNWYSVNSTNNTFYILNAVSYGAYAEIKIVPESYETMVELAAAVQTAIRKTLATATCTYDSTSRRLKFTLAGARADAYIICFQVKRGTRPVGVSEEGFFQDTHQLLGLIPTRTAGTILNAAGSTSVGTTMFSAPFPASLNTLEALYLRTSLMGGNFQTYGHERDLPNRNGLTETQIFARIPLISAKYDAMNPFVEFEDSNDLFQLQLQQKHIDRIEFAITDDKGRLLSEAAPGQTEAGLLGFKCVLRWDHVSPAPIPQREARVDPTPHGPVP
jgi:hypothetical protein